MKIKTFVRAGLGFSLLGLGAVGLILPVWPTTPFVLASFACFSSSPKIRAQILQIPFFSEYIKHYEQGKSLTLRTVQISLIWLWSMLVGSMLIVKEVWLTILLVVIGTTVTIHILWIARSKKDQ